MTRSSRILTSIAAFAFVGSVAGMPASARDAEALDAAWLERICEQNAPSEPIRDTCMDIVRTVLAPDGHLVLPAVPEASTPGQPEEGPGIGATQATGSLLVTLLAVEWEAALFPREDMDVVAAEFAFESTQPEAYLDTGAIVAVDEEGFSHPWGAIHTMGDGPLPGILPQGRRVRGWVAFEVPAGTRRLALEYRDAGSGTVLLWTITR